MRKQVVLISIVVLFLAAALAWRVRAENAYKHAPSGGSAVVEGVQTYVTVRTAGRITEVLVDEGDPVKEGQEVAVLDCVEQQSALSAALARVQAAEAGVDAARAGKDGAASSVGGAAAQVSAASAAERALAAQLELTEKNKQRAADLYDTGAIATASLDEAATRLDAAKQQRLAAEAQVRTARAQTLAAQRGVQAASAQIQAAIAAQAAARADVERAELAVAECTLVAPRDAVVTARLLEPGAFVGPGSRVLTLIDTRVARITFFLPNAELSRARLGAPAEVQVDAYPDKLFNGVVRRIAAEAEFTPRNVQTREDRDRLVYAVEVHVQNDDGTLRAGMPAEVSLPGTGQ